MMVGGNTMSMKDGMKIRGDINIALIVFETLFFNLFKKLIKG